MSFSRWVHANVIATASSTLRSMWRLKVFVGVGRGNTIFWSSPRTANSVTVEKRGKPSGASRLSTTYRWRRAASRRQSGGSLRSTFRGEPKPSRAERLELKRRRIRVSGEKIRLHRRFSFRSPSSYHYRYHPRVALAICGVVND